MNEKDEGIMAKSSSHQLLCGPADQYFERNGAASVKVVDDIGDF
jgi:hypothetical protein